MKRMIALFALIMVITGTVGMVSAEDKKFDWTVYENAPGYEYDKFEKRWSVSTSYVKKYSDANLAFGLAVVGTKTSIVMTPYLFGWIRDVKNRTGVYEVQKVDILIDDVLFSIKDVIGSEDSWTVPLDSANGKTLMEKLLHAKEVSLKYKTKINSIVVDLGENDTEDLKKLGKIILENDTWAYILDDSGRDAAAFDEIIKKRWPMVIAE